MTPESYRKVYDWFRARPAALAVLKGCTRLLPLAQAGAYLVLLALLAARTAAGEDSMQLLVRAVLVPGVVFAGGSALRAALNRPRPYEQPGFVPLLPKETAGKSFPSRHAVSSAVIAMAWLPVNGIAAGVLTVSALAICATRVLAGVHSVKDVAAGAALGFVLGAAGMLL